jgi:hypothetical protein
MRLVPNLSLSCEAAMLASCSTVPPAPLPAAIPAIEIPLPRPPAGLLEAPPPPRPLPRPQVADTEPPPLTPDQLFEGYANLAEDDRDVRGMLTALQQWIRERLGAE